MSRPPALFIMEQLDLFAAKEPPAPSPELAPQTNGRGPRHDIGQLYARENMNMPFRIRLNTDPDLSVGLKATIVPLGATGR